MNVRYRVTPRASERAQRVTMGLGGKVAARRRQRDQIRLAADKGSTDEEIARNVAVGTSTVYRTKQRFVEEGLERALSFERAAPARRRTEARCGGRVVARGSGMLETAGG